MLTNFILNEKFYKKMQELDFVSYIKQYYKSSDIKDNLSYTIKYFSKRYCMY